MQIYDDFFRGFPGYHVVRSLKENGHDGSSIIPHPLPSEFALSFFNEKKNGIFVDVGANDGIAWSNSLIFEKLFSWTGLCIEANPYLYKELEACRSCLCVNCAVDEDETEKIFWNIVGDCSGLSGLEKGFCHVPAIGLLNNHMEHIEQEMTRTESVRKKMSMVTRRLAPILAEHDISHIDYLSIDVEGNELGVLKGVDFDACSCTLISVESNGRTSTQNYLAKFGYNLLTTICRDDFYAR